jgi:high affinity sulfate transporter 1
MSNEMPQLKAELKSDLKAAGRALRAIGRVQARQVWARVSHYIPIATWLPKYDRSFLRSDVISGLTVWGVSVPSALAYAQLAGVPLQAGLYAAGASMLLYSIFATSRHVKVTASSTMAVMSAAVVAPLALGDPAYYWALTAMLAIIVGIILLGAGIVRLGFIADFLSKPVVAGFVFGLAISIAVGQLPKLFGVPGSSGNVFQQFFAFLLNLGQTHWITLAVGAGSLALILILRARVPQIPASLVALAAGIVVSALLNLDQYGVSTIGAIPTGLPDFGWPSTKIADLPYLIAGAFGIVFLAVGESLGSARAFGAQHHYEVNADQELIAMGLANIGTGLSQGMTVDASMSVSATADSAGVRTQLSGLVTAGMVLLTLLFIAPLFRALPNAVLAAIVIISVTNLMDVNELKRYYLWRRADFALSLTALVGVLISDVLTGLTWAVFLSLIIVLYRVSRPYLATLGKVPGPRAAYVDLSRNPNSRPIPGLAMFRLDAPLFFANANVAQSEMRARIEKQTPPVRAVLIDMGATSDLDVSSLDMLRDLVSDLRAEQREVMLTHVRGPARHRLQKTGLLDFVGADRIFYSIQAAVDDYQKRYPATEESAPQAEGVAPPLVTADEAAVAEMVDAEALAEAEASNETPPDDVIH